MPQYQPPPSLTGQPFTLVITDHRPEALAALESLIQTFPCQPGIQQVITATEWASPAFPDPLVVDPHPGEGQGPWLSRALEQARAGRILLLGGPPEGYPGPDKLKQMAEKLDLAHLVLAPRPQSRWSGLGRLFHGVWSRLGQWGLALDPKPEPGWPGWGAWLRRGAARWVMAVPGNDPETPIRMLRREMGPALNLQSPTAFARVEMIAKATFLGALVEELPIPLTLAREKTGPDGVPGWWADFRALCSDPVFGTPWNPLAGTTGAGEDNVQQTAAPAQTAV